MRRQSDSGDGALRYRHPNWEWGCVPKAAWRSLPAQYGNEIRELTSEFGVVRRPMSPYPIGLGTARPARVGARPAFGSVTMPAALRERSPSLSFASLESHKLGGIVRLPRKLDEQSMVPIGQFLARSKELKRLMM